MTPATKTPHFYSWLSGGYRLFAVYVGDALVVYRCWQEPEVPTGATIAFSPAVEREVRHA